MKLKIDHPIVSTEWLFEHKKAENLIILNATIAKVGTTKEQVEKQQIPNTIFFDLKGVFLDKEASFPNTIPSKEYFELEVRKLGINQDSCVVVYDELGIYSSARAWWLFKIFGFDNVAVLNGGLPLWKQRGYDLEDKTNQKIKQGNFKADFRFEKLINTNTILESLDKQIYCIVDARSKGRYKAEVKEPRANVRGGHIPTSNNLPHGMVVENGVLKTKTDLQKIFNQIQLGNKKYVFSCGTGITACILALALTVTGNNNYAIYDGSWTEWGSNAILPIEK